MKLLPLGIYPCLQKRLGKAWRQFELIAQTEQNWLLLGILGCNITTLKKEDILHGTRGSRVHSSEEFILFALPFLGSFTISWIHLMT